MSISMPEKKERPVFRPLYLLLFLLLLAGGIAVYWHMAGRVSLVGEVQDSVVSLSPGISGSFSRIEVREGDEVRKGQPLALLDSTMQRKIFAEEQQKLAQFEALLPPQYTRSPGPGAAYGQPQDDESLEERLARQRKDEASAERRLQNAADAEAQAAVTYNRASLLVSQGKLSVRERDAAAATLDEARRESQAAKAAFESRSLARSGTNAEIRRVKENQNAVGADTLPANLRIKNYELQRERVRAAAADLEATILRAPEDGIITEIIAKPGGPATAGAPCIVMASLAKGVTIVAQATDEISRKLLLRQQCRLEIAGASDNPYVGYISNFLPKGGTLAGKDAEGASAPGMRVQITVIGPVSKSQPGSAEPAPGESPALYLRGGAKADITVLLRSPLYAQNSQSPAQPDAAHAPQEKHSSSAPAAAPALPPVAAPAGAPVVSAPAASQEAAPHSPPNSAQAPSPASSSQDNPEGRLLPPVYPSAVQPPAPDSSQNPLEGKRPLPQLPPMQAPAKLNSSTEPDPKNNPSLVTPEILEREANKER